MKVLFVCLGNICRSPAAEAVFQKLIDKNNLKNEISCDSAGTSAYHAGEPADGRMSRHAKNRGYDLTSLSRGFKAPDDFQNFDMIITMDNSNYDNVIKLAPQISDQNKVSKLTSYCKIHRINEVPDPYAGGDEGFEHVMDIVEDGCSELFNVIHTRLKNI